MPEAKPYKRRNKNAPKNIDLNTVSYQFFGGVDLMAIEGVSHSTILTLMSEIGPDGLSKFKTVCSVLWIRCLTTAPPIKPAPPVTKIFISTLN